MTKAELIKLLADVPDDARIEIALNQYNKAYPVAWVDIKSNIYAGACLPESYRLNAWLPDNMRTSVRKDG